MALMKPLSLKAKTMGFILISSLITGCSDSPMLTQCYKADVAMNINGEYVPLPDFYKCKI